MLTLTDTDAMACDRVCVVLTVPCKLNGIVIANCPPKLAADVLWNHSGASCVRGMENWVCGRVKPVAAVNVTFRLVNVRVVVYPVTTRAKPFALTLVTWTATIVGAAGETTSCATGGAVGVRGTAPASVSKDGVSVIVSATVPVCKKISDP